MGDDQTTKKDDGPRMTTGRGPAYPSITLREAVERIHRIKDANAARSPLAPDTVFRIWGFKGASGASRPVLSSVGYYGLLDNIGRGDERKVRLSDLALRIVFDKLPDSPERAAAVREAALKPAIFERLMNECGVPVPDDLVLERFLVRDQDYSEPAAAAIIANYRDTLEYAGLDKPAITQPVEEASKAAQVVDAAPFRNPANTAITDMFRDFVTPKAKSVPMESHPQTVPGRTPSPMEIPDTGFKVMLDGDRIRIAGDVDLKGAKRLLKALKANIALLEDDDEDGDGNE